MTSDNPDIAQAAFLLEEFMDKALNGQKPDAKACLARCSSPGIREHFLKMAYALATFGKADPEPPGPDDGEILVIDFLQKLAA